MYNKLFTSILDSSIWLEEPATKVVWITLLAAMDEDGFAHFAAVKNLANRAVLTLEDTEGAVKVLESPDPNSSDSDHEGRRIERVPGGWIVLNARKYHNATTRAIAKQKTRERVTRFRQKKRIESQVKFPCNAGVTSQPISTSENATAPVTPETRSNSHSDTESETGHDTTDTGVPIPGGYSDAAKAVIALWHEVTTSTGLNILPVDKFTHSVESAANPYSDPEEVRKLFEWCVAKERERPSHLRKTIVRVLHDVATGEGFFTNYDPDEDSIPF